MDFALCSRLGSGRELGSPLTLHPEKLGDFRHVASLLSLCFLLSDLPPAPVRLSQRRQLQSDNLRLLASGLVVLFTCRGCPLTAVLLGGKGSSRSEPRASTDEPHFLFQAGRAACSGLCVQPRVLF